MSSANVVSTGGVVPAGDRIKGGFTACHLWRYTKGGAQPRVDAVRVPQLYSFVPNLAWLPTSLAVLTDHEGSFAQRYMQRLSVAIYKSHPVEPGMQPLAKSAWAKLAEPEADHDAPVDPHGEHGVNFVRLSSTTLKSKIKATKEAADALRTRAAGDKVTDKPVTGRYGPGLNKLRPDKVKAAAEFMEKYLEAFAKGRY